jgi:hypothetical protein
MPRTNADEVGDASVSAIDCAMRSAEAATVARG